ncbi:MAG TPA: ABC transporter substrate-binding protein [Gelria sp.]|jgi:glycine betaine/proline transport system substrate-binding protein|nr:ABC transporter substrate-binding protein [Gelria sp.]
MFIFKRSPGRFRLVSLGLVAVFLITLLVAGCGGGDGADKNGSDKPMLTFADVSWDSVQVHNRIAGFIIENGYGYPECQYTFGDSLPLLQGLGKGSVDIYMEVWADNYRDAWEEVLADGSVIQLGTNFPDAPQGWYVPTYMIKGDPERGIEPITPNLKSVSDLPEYWELFADPEVPTKGRFHNGPTGWKITDYNESKIKTYGLDNSFNVFGTGSETALTASMVSAYERGKPWLGYYWEPTWVMGTLDMTLLEEPEFEEATWEKNRGCAFPSAEVLIGVNSELEETAPEIVEFLKKYSTSLEHNNDFLAYMNETSGKADEAAIYFLKKYPDVWKSWIPEDVATKVEKALGEVK